MASWAPTLWANQSITNYLKEDCLWTLFLKDLPDVFLQEHCQMGEKLQTLKVRPVICFMYIGRCWLACCPFIATHGPSMHTPHTSLHISCQFEVPGMPKWTTTSAFRSSTKYYCTIRTYDRARRSATAG